MQLQDLSEIISGIDILDKHLYKKENEEGFLYLTSKNIDNAQILLDDCLYIQYNKYKKNYNQGKNVELEYGDFIIDKNSLSISYFNFEQRVIPSSELIIIRPFSGYLTQILLNSVGIAMIQQRLRKLLKKEDWLYAINHLVLPANFQTIEEVDREQVRPDKISLSDSNIIRVRQGVMSLAKVLSRIEHKEINLNTGFQRKSGLWEIAIKSRLIEALIVKQPIPAFYFDATETTEEADIWQIVDGLQRLTAIKEFILDEKFALENLYYLPQYEGMKFNQLPRSAQRNIEEFEIITYLIEAPTPKFVKYKIFSSINTSSLQLTPQEIRHAINQGKPSKWVEELTKLDNFYKVIPVSEKEKERMLDREIALRYLAFRMKHYEHVKNNSKELLDDAMTEIFSHEESELERYKNDLGETLSIIQDTFKEKSFTKAMLGDDNTGFINPLFEVWTYVISELNEEKKEILKKRKSILAQSTIKYLKNNDKFAKAIKSEYAYTKESLKIRFSEVEQLINDITQ